MMKILSILILAALVGGGAPPATVDDIAASLQQLHGFGPLRSEQAAAKVADDFDVRHKPAAHAAGDVYLIHVYTSHLWQRPTAIEEITALWSEAYEAGARWMLLMGPWHGGLPYDEHAHELIPDSHWEAMCRLFPAWLEEHPDATLGVFVRGNAAFDPPWDWQGEGYDRYRSVVDPFVEMGFRWIVIDASQRQPWIDRLVYREDAERELIVTMEATGDVTIARYPSRLIAANVLEHRFTRNGLEIPRVPEGKRWFVWVSNHTVAGTKGLTAWAFRGLTRKELAAEYRDRGWTVILQNIEDVAIEE